MTVERSSKENGAVDLTDFLLARIAEDEALARKAAHVAGDPRWEAIGSLLLAPRDGVYDVDLAQAVDYSFDFVLEHAGRHDPARVLAECEAKRQIVELHASWPVLVERRPQLERSAADLNDLTFRVTQQIAWTTQDEYRKRFGEEPPTAPMLCQLALPYADHPDYREEWRP